MPTRNVSNQSNVHMERKIKLEEESIVCLGEVKMNTFLEELLSFEEGVSPLAIKGSKN